MNARVSQTLRPYGLQNVEIQMIFRNYFLFENSECENKLIYVLRNNFINAQVIVIT